MTRLPLSAAEVEARVLARIARQDAAALAARAERSARSRKL